MFAGKLKEALAILKDLHFFLKCRQQPGKTPEDRPIRMTKEQAETLVRTIKARLPKAEVAVTEDEQGVQWVVEARNPRRGTPQIFQDPEQFEQLMEAAAGRQTPGGQT